MGNKINLPPLIRKSKVQGRVSEPTDTGLDLIIDKIFDPQPVEDIVSSGRVAQFARDVLYNLETNPETIKGRQEVLQYFLDNPELVKAVQNNRIRDREPEYHESARQRLITLRENAESFVSYIKSLNTNLKLTDFTPLQKFKDELDSFAKGRTAEIEELTEESKSPLRVEMSAHLRTKFIGSPHYDIRPIYSNSNVKVTSTRSGKLLHEGFGGALFGEELFKEIEKVARVPSGKASARVRISYETNEYGEGYATVSVRLKKIKKLSTFFESVKAFALGRAPRAVFESEKVEFNAYTSAISRRHYRGTETSRLEEEVKNNAFKPELERVREEISAFRDTLVQLRYLASLTNATLKIENRRIPTTFPDIALMEKSQTEINNLHDPFFVIRNKFSVVPNNVNAGKQNYVFLITGPNGNGKTTYMNAIGNTQAMFQAGWKVFAESATISPKDRVMTHMVRPGDLAVSESRYQHELSRIKELFSQVTPDSLVLIDELGTGTSPEDGLEEAKAVLNQIRRTGATTYISTHYHALIDIAEDLQNVGNLHCLSHRNNGDLHYTFKIEKGGSRTSEGTYLARKMGADEKGISELLEKRAVAGELSLR